MKLNKEFLDNWLTNLKAARGKPSSWYIINYYNYPELIEYSFTALAFYPFVLDVEITEGQHPVTARAKSLKEVMEKIIRLNDTVLVFEGRRATLSFFCRNKSRKVSFRRFCSVLRYNQYNNLFTYVPEEFQNAS